MAFKTMKMIRVKARTMLLGASVALSAVTASPAIAATQHHLHSTGHSAAAPYHHTAYHHTQRHLTAHHGVRLTNTAYSASVARMYANGHGHYGHYSHSYYHSARYTTHYRHSGLQCVPYAREISHISLSGNAYLWWAEASGRYARGNAPVQGAVLNFRAIGRMPLGHVAVVTAVIDNRTILVTQANWVRGTITNDVTVQDVSPNNDWTNVKVELGDTSASGASYPTYGFIYNQPDNGTVIAANGQSTEVAEAPPVTQVSDEAPNRNLQ
jgi:surface antigen